jgi:Cys-tRNA(Pro)/Cys-tRNA(Cys) deacylase
VSRSTHRVPATPATRALEAARVAWVGHVYTHDPAVTSYGREAADALGVDVGRVFKTLMVDVDGALAVAIVPVADRLDLGALAATLGGKRAVLADRALAERRTGYVAGGISPLGQRNAHRTVLDASALEHETVFVSGGRRGFDVEVAAGDLVGLTDAAVADIVVAQRSAP